MTHMRANVQALVLLAAAGSAFAQDQMLLRGPSAASLQAIGRLNAELGALQLRDLGATPGNLVVSVPEANRTRWLQGMSTINSASPLPFGVTPLTGDYRSLFYRLPSTQGLTLPQENKLKELRLSFGVDRVNLVKLAPTALVREAVTAGFDTRDGFSRAGSISLPLEPGRTLNLTQESRVPTDGGYLWRGKASEGGAIDEATFVSNGDNMTGTVRVGREIFTYLPLGEGIHAVTRQGTTGGPAEHPPRMLEKLKGANTKDAPPAGKLDVSDAAVIDVMVVFSAKAAAGLADLRGLATLAVEDANKSFGDSGIPSVSLKLVHVGAVPYKEGGTWNSHLDRLTNPVDSELKQVHTLREKVRADIVVLVVKDDEYCGEARDIGVGQASAFAVVSRTCMLAPYYSFVHELGHLLGARHDLQSDPEVKPLRWAHGYVHAKRWRTVMAYDVCDGCPRILRWSTPHAMHEAQATGTPEFEHDARVWLEYAKRASQFR